MKPEDIFKNEMLSLKADLIQKHIDLGMKATGKWIDNLEVFVETEVDFYIAEIIGLDYTEQLVQGREPGAMPPIQNLVEWIEAKPITPRDNISVESLAWAIAKKIAREGTNYFPEGTDLVEAVITKERIQKIIDNVGELLINDFKLEINEALNRVAI